MLRVEVQRLNVAKREAEARAAANQARQIITVITVSVLCACPIQGAPSAKFLDTHVSVTATDSHALTAVLACPVSGSLYQAGMFGWMPSWAVLRAAGWPLALPMDSTSLGTREAGG